MYIAEYISKFKRTKYPYSLFRTLILIVKKGRIIKTIFSIWCFLRYRPSKVVRGNDSIIQKAHLIISHFKVDLFFLSKNEIIEKYQRKYSLDFPDNFNGARSEGIVEIGSMLINGEYSSESAKLAMAPST